MITSESGPDGASAAGADAMEGVQTLAAVLFCGFAVYMALGVMHGRSAGRTGIHTLPHPVRRRSPLVFLGEA